MDDDRFKFLWPDARITVRDGRLTMVEARELQNRTCLLDAAAEGLAESGVYLADVFELERSDGGYACGEVFIKFLAEGDGVADAKDRITEWGRTVGRTRVWFEDEVRDLRGDGGSCGTVSSTCPTCGQDWVESNAAFWQMVTIRGEFPTTCLLCGGLLHQWTVESGKTTIEETDVSVRPSPIRSG